MGTAERFYNLIIQLMRAPTEILKCIGLSLS